MEHKIRTVKIEFKSLPNLIMTIEQYNQIGKFKGFLREYSMPINYVKKVHHILMKPENYPTQAWEG